MLNKAGAALVVILCAVLTYVLFGSFFQYLWLTWKVDPFYAQGLGIVGLSFFLYSKFLWEERHAPVLLFHSKNLWAAFLCFILFSVFFIFGAQWHLAFLGGVAFLLWFISIQCLFFDLSLWKQFSFPGIYFLLAVPIPYLSELSGRLQIFISMLCERMFQGLGYPLVREGVHLVFPNARFYIADECTGIKSWLVLFSLVVFFLYFFKMHLKTKIWIGLSLLLIAFLTNFLRVVALLFVGYYQGESVAMKYWHDFSGIFFYGVATLLTLGVTYFFISYDRSHSKTL